MTKSMTAFSRLQVQGDWGSLVWEIRSVNHRYLETMVRLPEELRAIEVSVRGVVAKVLERGKVECNLRYKPPKNSVSEVVINEGHARAVVAALHKIDAIMEQSTVATANDVLRWPGVVSEPDVDFSPLQKQALSSLSDALSELIAVRETEGSSLQALILQRCDAMNKIVSTLREHRPDMLKKLSEKMHKRINDHLEALNAEPDQGRLEQELVMLAQKLDVDEEMDRLETHLTEVREVLKRDEAIGRRLDFLMQELNREANTLGSKSQDTSTTQLVVDLKVYIEQMREQVQNIE
ncbi:MAG: YicC family protein [Gammaproteobacteria bacterium]|nr:YicC family protein [Gammaproteobacteria bacterium]